MKRILWLILIWAFQQIASGGEIVKTKRMVEIEAKFNMKILFVTEDEKTWVFVGSMSERMFRVLPVCVPKNAVDHDVQVAINASNNCAVFYEVMLKKAAGDKAPVIDSVLLMPTHPQYAWTDPAQGR